MVPLAFSVCGKESRKMLVGSRPALGEFTVIKSSEVSDVKPRWSLSAQRDKQRHHIDSPIQSHCSWQARRQIGHF